MTPASLAFSDIFANQTLCHIRHTPTGKNPNPRPLDLPPTFTRAREQTIPNARCQQTRTPEQRTLLNLLGFLTPNPAHSPAPYTRSSNNSKKSPKQLGFFRPT